jgi:hypothetical protein
MASHLPLWLRDAAAELPPVQSGCARGSTRVSAQPRAPSGPWMARGAAAFPLFPRVARSRCCCAVRPDHSFRPAIAVCFACESRNLDGQQPQPAWGTHHEPLGSTGLRSCVGVTVVASGTKQGSGDFCTMPAIVQKSSEPCSVPEVSTDLWHKIQLQILARKTASES